MKDYFLDRLVFQHSGGGVTPPFFYCNYSTFSHFLSSKKAKKNALFFRNSGPFVAPLFSLFPTRQRYLCDLKVSKIYLCPRCSAPMRLSVWAYNKMVLIVSIIRNTVNKADRHPARSTPPFMGMPWIPICYLPHRTQNRFSIGIEETTQRWEF